ncbi:ATP-binding protein [Terrimonas sp. NA20]|uniref:ATP-binding protein n=1 Tax=Terrimonas ginsenosidimutans TaxID=2908004 RepID=A0ABS9KKJ3_9BACT|nr:histidine kinase dimerization/phosphoacceptor domain -containing protein [Terrimonas ginsenosidimutans]MCG2612827.1 ATP-binding protein [Terrimonas ginsenosidimutans]
MKKRSFLIAVILLTVCNVAAQHSGSNDGDQFQINSKDQQQIEQWVKRSWYFIDKSGTKKKDLDSAFAIAQKAAALSNSLHYVKGFNQSTLAASVAKMENGETGFAHRSLSSLNDTTQVLMLTYLQKYFLDGESVPKNLDSAVASINTALSIARKKKDYRLELRTYKIALGEILKYGHAKQIEEYKSKALLLKSRVKPEDMIIYYFHVSNYAHRATDDTKSLEFALEGIALSESTNGYMLDRLYGMLGVAYSGLKQFRNSVEACKKAIELGVKKGDTGNAWILTEYVAHDMSHLHAEDEALQYLEDSKIRMGFSRLKDSIIYYRSIAFVQNHAKRFDEANRAYLAMTRLSETNEVDDPITYNHIGKYYFDTKKYDSARTYLERTLTLKNITVSQSIGAYSMLFRLDTVEGNYRSAMFTLMRMRKLQDSAKKNEHKSEMQQLLVQYEAQKKDKDLQLQQQSIELLTQKNALREKDLEQTQLNFAHERTIRETNLKLSQADAAEKSRNLQIQQASITLLQQETSLKQAAINKASFTRDMLIAGAVLLFIILSLVLNRYMLKRKNAAKLSERNEKLEQLVHEKELLVKEVHHRVKNNLHTILSLLESQAVFLQDDALAAVQKSQSRVYAMSLIHQKLYKQENTTSVNMEEYLPELLMHLENSFAESRPVVFRKNIEPIQLDVSQAIPLGLILNEAISNSIKYAFPSNQKGLIHVALIREGSSEICLTIRDNGIGLPPNWEKHLNQSLGIKLIRGLSQDIHGECRIYNDKGTTVSIRFRKTDFTEIYATAKNMGRTTLVTVTDER